MKLLRSLVGSLPLFLRFPAARFSTDPAAVVAAVEEVGVRRPRGWADTLYSRVVLVADPKASIVPVLEKWIEEGKHVSKDELQAMLKQMRSFRRYAHALQISKWMSDRRYLPLSPGDFADRLDLIYRVHGIEHAENYFNNISVQKKGHQPYGALLNCYALEKSVEKAEALVQKMQELGMLTSFSYNSLMKLYSRTGQQEKVNYTFQDMEKKGIPADVFTYSILMEAYAAASNVNGIDKLLQKLRRPTVVKSWHVYAVAAKGYANAGLTDQALEALRKAEELLPQKKARVAYGFLLTVYSEIGSKDEVYRIWNAYKSQEKQSNSIYMCMITGLLKLDDLEGAEMILKEWEGQTSFFDFRVPNLLVAAYCRNGLLGKAEALVNEAITKGRTPFANTWERLATAYFEDEQPLKAVEFMKKALMAAQKHEWRPSHTNLIASLEYFKNQKSVEDAEEFVRVLRSLGPLSQEVYHRLLGIYLAAEKSISGVVDRMMEDGFSVDEETNKIIETENSQKHSSEKED